MSIKIALAGNPNCGKTTLFNNLTGSNQYVGNWPGVTVEKKEGKLKGDKDVIIQDLPGIYSLSPYTLEEVVSRTYLVKEKPDAILNIIDGTNIERNLYLTTQLIELGIPVVMAVNMIDLVRKNGDKIDLKKLSNELGCEAVEISALKNEGSEKAAELAEKISKYARVKLDDSDNAPGWKFSQWEMKGVPLRLEIGPKDLEKNQCVLVRRDTREKIFVSLDELETAIPAQLEALRKDLYERALANREKRTWAATTMEEVKELAKANTGYIKTMWCGDLACEMKMKEEAGLSSRCMPFEQEHLSDVCPCCGKPASKMVYWGVAY